MSALVHGDRAVVLGDDDVVLGRARVRRDGAGYCVEDLDGGGTTVNELRVTRQALSHGDLIRCGELRLRFVEERGRDEDLAGALVAAVRGDGAAALSLAAPWPEHWVGKIARFIAHSFLLHEPTRAIDVFGGPAEITALMASDRVEKHVLVALSSLLRRETPQAMASARAALGRAPGDRFVALVYALVAGEHG